MRLVSAARGVLTALMVVLLSPIAFAADQEAFYLGTDGFPRATLVANPLGGEIPNFDKGRDVEPGLLLERSSLGLEETDGARFQHWQVEAGGTRVVGYPAVVIWAAPAGFDASLSGFFTVYLLDCNQAGEDCTVLGSDNATIARGLGSEWVESWLSFDSVDHRFGSSRYLGVRVVVPDSSQSDLMFAYGYPQQRSRLAVYSEPPALPEPTVTAAVQAAPFDVALKEKLHRIPEMTVIEVGEDEQVVSPWAWVVTLVVSTALLVAVGAFLLAGLTRPGRHERPTAPAERRVERVPVSTR